MEGIQLWLFFLGGESDGICDRDGNGHGQGEKLLFSELKPCQSKLRAIA